MSKRLNGLKEDIQKGDARLGEKLDHAAAVMVTMIARLKGLKDVIPEGADQGSYEDFEAA